MAEPTAAQERASLTTLRRTVASSLMGLARRADQFDALKGIATRIDGWANVLTGIGTSASDKVTRTMPTVFRRINDQALSALFNGDATAKKACTLRNEECLGKGFTVSFPKERPGAESKKKAAKREQERKDFGYVLNELSGEARATRGALARSTTTALTSGTDEEGPAATDGDMQGAELSTQVQDELERLGFVHALLEALVWEDLFGGSAIWMGCDDGYYDFDSQEQPLNLAQLERVNFIRVLDRRRIWPDYGSDSIDQDTSSATHGQPTLYWIDGSGNGYQVRVHVSRLIIFPGQLTTYEHRQAWNGWGTSVLDAAWAALQRNGMVWGSSANAVSNAQYTVYKLKGLDKMLSSEGGEKKASQRAQAMEMAKSMINAILIDSEDEYLRENPDFGNLPEMIDRFMYDVSHALDMPVTKLFGRSPAGENATGESDENNWHGSLGRKQELHIRPRVHKFVEAILAQKQGPTRGKDPGGWRVVFNALKEMSGTEKADIRLKTSQADQIDITTGVLTANEVARSRFRAEGYSTETTIDLETREENAEADAELLAKQLEAEHAAADFAVKNPGGPPKLPAGEDADKKPAAKKSE